MPPTMTRAEQRARRALADWSEQARALDALLATLSERDFEHPSRVSDWTVRDLIGRLLFLATDVSQTLTRPTATRPASLPRYLRTQADAADVMHRLTADVVGNDTGKSLARQLASVVAAIDEANTDALPAVVESLYEPVRTPDYLRATIIELVAHCDDLCAAVPRLREHEVILPSALATAVRALAEVLAEEHPGHQVEVRVPPVTAVQIASRDERAASHTRGTPPTVVEISPRPFLRLATGRITWDDTVAQRLVRASGAHAEIGDFFPVTALNTR